MKKMIFLFIFINIFSMNLFAFKISLDDYEAEGLDSFSSLSYDNIFNSDYKYFTLDILERSFYPSSSVFTEHMGLLTQFSFDLNIFDIYLNLGFTIYPFKKIFSVSGNFCFGLSIYTLNHFSYITDIKANIDIPIFKGGHNLTFGTGLRHRNALKIIGYFNLDSDYYKIYNSYFFEIGYRFIIK